LNEVYKVRDPETGLFLFSEEITPSWNSTGTIYTSIAQAEYCLAIVERNERHKMGAIVEFSIIEVNDVSPVAFDAFVLP
jgi:hypothetical protein